MGTRFSWVSREFELSEFEWTEKDGKVGSNPRENGLSSG